MIAILKPNVTDAQIKSLSAWFRAQGLSVHLSRGEYQTVMGLIGDTSKVDTELVEGLDTVQSVMRISEPYKSANRKFHPLDTVVSCGGAKIGGGNFALIAGPCSVESEAQIVGIAHSVKSAGAAILRGGAFHLRTSPYAFQGLQQEGLDLLVRAKEQTGLPIVTEIVSVEQLPLFDRVDLIQVSGRNMQNFDLLRELGKTDKPILLKRGPANTIDELLMSAEHIMAGGNERVVLCEQGIRTFETHTRTTLDLSAIPALHELTHLPVVVDPSRAALSAGLIAPMALAAVAAGADGVMIEVHNDPSYALCDGAQSITPDAFTALAKQIEAVRRAVVQ